MSLFDFGGNSDPNAGFMMPMAAQAMRYDPRSALIAQMLQTGQQQIAQPSYSPASAIAKALTMGLGGLSSAELTDQYMNAAKAAPQEIGKALSGGANGGNPVESLINSPNPIAQMYGYQMMPEYYKPTVTSVGQQIKVPATNQTLATNTTPLSEPGKVAADLAANPAVAGANAAVKGAEAGATAQAQVTPDIEKAVGIAVRTAPIDVQKAIQTAYGTLTPEVIKNIARDALIPRPVTPTERLQSGFAALPPAVQDIITRAVSGGAGATQPPGSAPLPGPPPPKPSIVAPSSSTGGIPAAMTPAQYEAETSLGKDFADKDKKAYDSANTGLQSLYQMNAAADKLAHTGGWATPGAGVDMRADFAKTVNTWQQAFGFKPSFDPSTVSSWELMGKETKRAGMQLVNQMFGGSREAASIINGATAAVPNSENTYLGYRLVSSSVEQTLQRERDLYAFKAKELAAGKPLSTAEVDFNKQFPPGLYTQRAIANAVPDTAVSALEANHALAGQFDAKFGKGMAAFVLGGGRTGLGTAAMAGVQ